MDVFRELAHYAPARGELRRLDVGDEPLETDASVVRVVVLGDTGMAALSGGRYLDSQIAFAVPTADLENEELFAITVSFYLGEGWIVDVASERPVPLGLLRHVVGQVGVALREYGGSEGYPELAYELKDDMCASILRARTRAVEQSVRNALDDDVLTRADYAVLRTYPAHLACVERLAEDLLDIEPVVESQRPPSDPLILRLPQVPRLDLYHRNVRDAGHDAREAVTRLSGLMSSQQIVLSQRQAVEAARFQRTLTLVGAAVLVPGLVAAVFGANVGFHGRDGVEAFWAMLCFMVAGGVGSYGLFKSVELDLWKPVRRRLSRIIDVPESSRPLLMTAVALLAAAAGLGLLSCAS